MKKMIILAFLLGGPFLSIRNIQTPSAWSKVILSDKFVFKIAGEVFTLNDLYQYFDEMNNLKCIYPETLLYKVFFSEFHPKNRSLFKAKTKFTSEQKAYFTKLIKFGKTLVYSKSHDVLVEKSIEKYLFLSARRQNCKLTSFDNKNKFKKRLREIVRLEIFMRSRFLPTEKQGKTTALDLKKAVSSSRNLISSIYDQIDQEIYW